MLWNRKIARDDKDPDAHVFTVLKDAGSDFAKPHVVDFYLYFPEKAAAEASAEFLAGNQFKTQVLEGATKTESWLCLATRVMMMDTGQMRKWREFFTGLATRAGGEYDGWECAIVNE